MTAAMTQVSVPTAIPEDARSAQSPLSRLRYPMASAMVWATLRMWPLPPPSPVGRELKRSVWMLRALMTRSRMTADGSPGFICESWAKGTAWISQWMSIRAAVLYAEDPIQVLLVSIVFPLALYFLFNTLNALQIGLLNRRECLNLKLAVFSYSLLHCLFVTDSTAIG